MAVEIPIIIDIDKAFQDASKRVKTAMQPLQRSVDDAKINVPNFFPQIGESLKKLELARDRVHELTTELKGLMSKKEAQFFLPFDASKLDRVINALLKAQASLSADGFNQYVEGLSRADFELLRMAEHYKALEISSMKMSDSINGYRARMADLNEQWNRMTAAERNSAEGQAVYKKYVQEANALRTVVLTLDEKMAKEQAAANATIQSQKRAQQSRKYEAAILKSTVTTLKVLQEQERILSDRLSRTPVGTSKYNQLKNDLDGVRTKLQQINGSVGATTNALRAQGPVLQSLASYASMYFSVFGLIRFEKQIRDVTGELEYQRIALGHLIQDEEYGAKLFEDIKQAALKSPFQIKDLVTYTKQLAAYRIEQENLFETTSRLADISAGLGVDMNRLILAYGQVRSASVLRGQELRQFTEAGIPLVELLADKMGELHNTTYRTADVFKLISERAVPFSAIADIFEDLTEKGGMFYKMQERQADTLKGRWEKLKDAFTVGIQAAGETNTFLWQNNLLLNTLTVLAKNVRFVPKLIEAAGFAWLAYTLATIKSTRATKAARIAQIQLTADEIKEITAKNLSAKATNALTRARIMEKAATNAVTRTWWRLNAAMIANPIGVIVAGVTALISLFVFWRKKTDEQTASFKDLTDAIENVSASEKQYNRMKKQIEAYERLASKTERTAKENVDLANTLNVLREAFPGVTLTVDETNASLSSTVDLLNKLNEEKKLEGIQKAFRAREMAQNQADELRQTIAKLTRDQDVAWQDFQNKTASQDAKGAKKAREEYDKLGEQLDENNKQYIQTLKYIQALDKYLNPDKDSGLAVWQKTMMAMKDFTVDGKSFNLIGEGDIEGYESLYKGLKAIDKMYQDSTESAKEMKAALSSVSAEYREDAEQEIRIEEARRDAAKAILDTFGYVSKIDQKKDTSSLAILKEELKNVQDIYKRYKEFLKYMTVDEARKKIKEIYGSVTAIDFLSPETYKKRLADLLSELRALQGRVKVGAKKLSADMADDLKAMLRGDEGFRSKAYKLKGEKAYTIGYGFYNQLTDGRKVVEGMTMTMEEAEAELDRQVQRTANTTSKLIEQYGKGIQLTERQFNILANLAYQGPATLKRALQEANGDANRLADALENAAWPYVAKPHQAAVKNRDMRRALMFRLAGATNDEETKELQSTIFDLEKIVQDVDWDELEESIKKRLEKISEDIKRSEEARKFFENILDLTGDEKFAANMTLDVYGDLGHDFKERIQEQLYRALTEIDPEHINKDLLTRLIGDTTIFDIDDIRANIDQLPKEVKEEVQKALDIVKKYNADVAADYAKLLNTYDEIEQQKTNITNKAVKDRKTIEKGLALELEGIEKNKDITDKEAAKKAARERADAAIGGVERDTKLQLSRLEKDYRLFFSSVGVLSNETARKVAEDQKKMLTDQFVQGEISFSKYRREIDEIDKQLEKYMTDNGVGWAYFQGGISSAIEKIKEYAASLTSLASVIKVGKDGVWSPSDDDKSFLDKIDGILNFGAFSKIFKKDALVKIDVKINDASQKAYNEAIKQGKSEAEAMAAASAAAGEVAAKTGNEMASAASKFSAGFAQFEQIFYSVDSLISFMEEDTERMRKQGGHVEDWGYGLFNLNKGIVSAYEQLKSGNVLGGMINLGKGIQQMIHPIQPLNNAIEDQGKLIDDLEYSYSRLEDTMAKSFGSEYIYNYNKQLEILEAKAAAYAEQARLEREKGKMADESIAEGYEKSAREIQDKISDMQAQLSEFFSGTDIASAAEDFANAWIEAYKEFGSTADAMSDKFNEMISNMINRSLAAKIMQEMLQPIFDQIDTMSRDGLLSTEEIASIAALAQERIPLINDAMTNLMSSLASAGLDVRTSTAGFHGISKDIAGASEESILGLAAGINTQNFYMSYMPTISENVAQILATMTGGVSPTAPVATTETGEVMPSVQQMIYDNLPNMNTNLSELLRLFRSVVTTKNSRNYVAIQ